MIYNNYRTRSFSDIFGSFTDFNNCYESCGILKTIKNTDPAGTDTKPNYLKNLYYLLLAEYANSHIASSDENRFKLQVMSIIFQYGPAWQRKLEIQEDLRNVDESEMIYTKAVYNKASNPNIAPSTDTTEGIDYLNDQAVNHYGRNKIDAYNNYMNVLKSDFTSAFLQKFKKLFTKFSPEIPLLYVTDAEEEDEEIVIL